MSDISESGTSHDYFYAMSHSRDGESGQPCLNTFTLTIWQESAQHFLDFLKFRPFAVGRSSWKMEGYADSRMEKNCRACSTNSTILVDLFSSDISDPPIWEMLNSILDENCRVNRDALPQKICPACLVAAQNAFHFKVKCEQSFEYFSHLLLEKLATNQRKLRCRKAEKSPLIAFEMVGCEDPLDPINSEREDNRLDLKTDNVGPTAELTTKEVDCEAFEEVFEPTASDNIERDEHESNVEILKDALEEEDNDDNQSESEGESEWSTGWTEDQDEAWMPYDVQLKSVNKDSNQSLLCTECGMTCKTHKSLANHVARHRQKEDPQKPHLCDYCGRGFRTSAQLTVHTRRHTGERPFQCPLCPKSYTHGPTLKSHMLTHEEEKAHKCPQCDKAFYTLSNMRAHQQWHKGDRPYKCPECPQAFIKNSGLKLHSRLHKEERPFKCELCGKGFVQSQHLVTHLRVHNEDRQFKCPDCDKSFYEKSNMKKHQRTHTGEKPFKCEECGHAFSHNHHLKSHLRIHTGEKPYKCDQCGKCFCANQSLAKHLLWHVENNDRPYKCAHCAKAFETEVSLRGHQKTHKKPDEPKTLLHCPHCEVKFALQKTLDKHIISHKIRPYPCPHCPEGFFSQKSFKKHQRTCKSNT
ncbi:zinc finger protein 436 [Drosophila ficusphila]|uniref:zinc finger protein 436 n=1 Tax=Drosophila ficusphila TaxID=30025 RepID=UPI0007E6A303|nr:zinc finger protein 436 [Drosophila ficusphila]